MTNNTIPNVPRELLEVIEQTWRIHYQGSPVTTDIAADAIEKGLGQLRALLSAPSPAGVDGLEVVLGEDTAFGRKYVTLSDAQAIIDGLRGEVERLQRAEKNDAIAYKAALERQDELRAELAALKAQGVVMPGLRDFEEWWCSTPILRESKRTLAEKAWIAARLNAATVLEVNAHCAVIPEPYGWVAAGSFYTDRESAICAAEKTPCINVYSRPQMNALENRSLQRQELAEELARQLNASCAEIRNMRNLYAAALSAGKEGE